MFEDKHPDELRSIAAGKEETSWYARGRAAYAREEMFRRNYDKHLIPNYSESLNDEDDEIQTVKGKNMLHIMKKMGLRWWEEIIVFLHATKFFNKLYICKPYFKHLTEKVPYDMKHLTHKWSAGMILFDHIEPDGHFASDKHSDFILFKLFTSSY